MHTVYYDDSGSPSDTLAVVVAGFVADDTQWSELERNWNETLRAFGIGLFHMKEFAHSRGDFSKWKDHLRSEDQKREREAFLRQLVGHTILRARHSFGHAVLMDAYREVNQGFVLAEAGISPYALCGRTCVARVSIWAQTYAIPQESVRHVFEDGSLNRGDLRDRMLKDKGIAPIFRKKADCVPLQAADLLAYEHLLGNRDIFQKGVDTFEGLRYPIRQLENIPHDPLDWGTYTRSDLEQFCVAAGIPRRNSLQIASAP